MPDPLPLVERLREAAGPVAVPYLEADEWKPKVRGLLREAAAALEANTVLLLAAEALASRRTCQCPADEFVSEHRYACPIAIALEIRALRLAAKGDPVVDPRLPAGEPRTPFAPPPDPEALVRRGMRSRPKPGRYEELIRIRAELRAEKTALQAEMSLWPKGSPRYNQGHRRKLEIDTQITAINARMHLEREAVFSPPRTRSAKSVARAAERQDRAKAHGIDIDSAESVVRACKVAFEAIDRREIALTDAERAAWGACCEWLGRQTPGAAEDGPGQASEDPRPQPGAEEPTPNPERGPHA